MTEIKTCPFCRSEKTEVKIIEADIACVFCKNCGSRGPERGDIQSVIAAWNQLARMREALEEIRDSFYARHTMPAEHMIEVYSIANQALKGDYP